MKGGAVRFESNRWFVPEGAGWRATDPVDQCMKALRFFRTKLEEKFGKIPLQTSYAIACPYVTFGDADLQGHEEVVIDGSHLPHLAQRLRTIVDSQSTRMKPLLEQVASVRGLLNPIFHTVSSVQSSILSGERHLLRLTTEQIAVLMQVLVPARRALVSGPAGTGKTVLARALALRRAAEGKRTLLLCFNRALKDELLASVELEDAAARERLEVQSIHGLAVKLCAIASCPDLSRDGAQHAVDPSVHFTHVIERAGGAPLYDAVVVDEGQDVTADGWLMILSLLTEPDGGLTIFYDPLQELYDASGSNARFIEDELGLAEHGTPLVPFRLSVNVRNDPAIARYLDEEYHAAYSNVDLSVAVHDGVQLAEGKRAPWERLESIVRGLLADGVEPRQIAILSAKMDGSFTDGHTEIAGAPVVREARTEHRGAIRLTSVGKFKGLEADVVVLIDVDRQRPDVRRAWEYVGASRGQHRVIILE